MVTYFVEIDTLAWIKSSLHQQIPVCGQKSCYNFFSKEIDYETITFTVLEVEFALLTQVSLG